MSELDYPDPVTNPNTPYTYQELTNEHLIFLKEETTITHPDPHTITITLTDRSDENEPTRFDVGHVRPGINTIGDVYDSLDTVLDIIINTLGSQKTSNSIDELKPGLYYKHTTEPPQETTNPNTPEWQYFDPKEKYASYAAQLEQVTYDDFDHWLQLHTEDRGYAVRKLRNEIMEHDSILTNHDWPAAQKLATQHLRSMDRNQRKEERLKDPERHVKLFLERQGRYDGRTASHMAKSLKRKGLLADELTDDEIEDL